MFNFNTEITNFVFSIYCTCALFLFHPLFFGQNKRMLFAAAHVQKNVPHDYNTNGNNRFFYVILIFTMEFFSKTRIHKNLCTCRFFSQCFTAKKIQLLLLKPYKSKTSNWNFSHKPTKAFFKSIYSGFSRQDRKLRKFLECPCLIFHSILSSKLEQKYPK